MGHAPGTPMIVAVPSGESVSVRRPRTCFPGSRSNSSGRAPDSVAANGLNGHRDSEVTGAPIPVTPRDADGVGVVQVEARCVEEKELRASRGRARLAGLSVLVAPMMGLSGLIAAAS